ncbi:MAG: gamma-glutamyl-gamma-aminobutyrate hydrolase family protein, partial [Proteobacteria bacterium]|nr:gamma-glutamyl-gamma-aminobutyrate hydrolase family protein [Pseudomonadota bacterium]
MSKPLVGVIASMHLFDERVAVQQVGERNLRAVAEVAGALPMMFAGCPNITDISALLDVVDGILLTGARANVHPTQFGVEPHPSHEPYDENRDAVALRLTRACVERGVPILGVCRGFQEMNVAFGGALHPEIRDLPGRMNHRMPPDGTLEEKFALRHPVRFTENGPFHKLFGATEVMTNTLHGQGIKQAGKQIVIDGYAPDGTPEAIYVAGAPGFTMSVQWHPEYRAAQDPVSRPLFAA